MAKKQIVRNRPARSEEQTETLKMLKAIADSLRANATTAPSAPAKAAKVHQPEPEPELDDDIDMEQETDPVDDPDLRDRRELPRKVYVLTPGALNRTHKIPERPSACRKVFRYLERYGVGTVRQMSEKFTLEKKTVGNALSALALVKLIQPMDIPR